jgi:hypothetical protein
MKDDLTDENIEEHQEEANLFFQKWIELNGRAGMTNCIHLLGAGHIAEHMFHRRNLHQHSQQSWKAKVSLEKKGPIRSTRLREVEWVQRSKGNQWRP